MIFTGNYAVDPEAFSVNFEAFAKNDRIVFSITREALQDINPDQRTLPPEDQYRNNKTRIQEAAMRLYQVRSVTGGKLIITKEDIET